jgi:hypothetical protein
MDATLTLGIRNITETTREYEYRGGPADGTAEFNGLTYTEEAPGRTIYLEFKGVF